MSRRRPNPWITVPSLLLGALAGGLGWTVTYLTCGTGGQCIAWSIAIALVSFLAVLIGTGIVLVLVYRSLGEWREAVSRGEQPPGPGCEGPEPNQ